MNALHWLEVDQFQICRVGDRYGGVYPLTGGGILVLSFSFYIVSPPLAIQKSVVHKGRWPHLKVSTYGDSGKAMWWKFCKLSPVIQETTLVYSSTNIVSFVICIYSLILGFRVYQICVVCIIMNTFIYNQPEFVLQNDSQELKSITNENWSSVKNYPFPS